jgi:hypothetical protein
MLASLRALLSGIIDYAGLFPPAKLPLDQAIRNYARYRQEPESWMLGRFVCPAARLAELAPFQQLFQEGPPFTFSALGRGGNKIPDFGLGVLADLRAIDSFLKSQRGGVIVDVLETRLPEEIVSLGTNKAIPLLGKVIGKMMDSRDLPLLTPFYEFVLGPEWRSSVAAVIADIATDHQPNAQGFEFCRPGGFKLRCGGLEASAFPTPEQVAFTIVACRDGGVPLKFTAGLHHPIRHFDKGVQTHMHGFLNVFGAGVLAHALGLNEEQVRQIIEDEDPRSFVFPEAGLRWKDFQATTEEIKAARAKAVISFGSCSFDEPRDDLRALGLLS